MRIRELLDAHDFYVCAVECLPFENGAWARRDLVDRVDEEYVRDLHLFER